MKCPNCSFMNPDQSAMCKICGYEFDTTPSVDTSSNTSHKTDLRQSETEDSEIEVTFDTLFGVKSNPRKIKNPLDKSKDKKRLFSMKSEDTDEPTDDDAFNERVLDKETINAPPSVSSIQELEPNHHESVLRPTIPVYDYASDEVLDEILDEVLEEHDANHEMNAFEDELDDPTFEINDTEDLATTDDSDDEVIDIELNLTGDIRNDFYTGETDIIDSDDYNSNNRRVTIILLAVVLFLIVAVFAFTSSKLNLNPFASKPDPTSTELVDNPAENQDNPQTEPIIHTTPDVTIQSFFDEIPAYVNDGNISFLMYFNNPQTALETLTTIKNKGSIDAIEYEIKDNSSVSDTNALIKVVTTTDRLKDNKHVISEDEWTFEMVFVNEQWLIDQFSYNNETTTSTTDNSNTNTSNTNNNTDTSSNTNTSTTKPVVPEGFVKSGSFKGGIITDGQDISGIRYGNHDQFERLVIDLSEWQNTNADGSPVKVKEACHYEATISQDGLEVNIVLSGVRAASATAPVFADKSNLKSLDIYYPSDDSSIGLSITLKKVSQFKVFSLKDPGRIVIDIMPNN